MAEPIDLDLYPSSGEDRKPSKKALGKRKAPASQSSQDGKGFESETDSEGEEKPMSKMEQIRAQAAANKAAPRFIAPLPSTSAAASSSRISAVKKEAMDVDRVPAVSKRDNPFLNGGRNNLNKSALNGLNQSALNGGRKHLNGAASGKAATLVPDAALPVPLTVAETKCRSAEKYPGRNLIQPGVKMTFQREPTNAWDRNAIQVKIGQSICGYIPKGVAGKLSPFIDTQRLTMTIAAGDISNHKARGSTDIPIKLSIYGSRTLMLEQDLAWAFNQSADSKPNAALADPMTGEIPKMKMEEEAAQDEIRDEMERTRTVAVRAASILGSLFAENSVDVALLPVCDQPPRMRPTTVLLKHQLQGLRWMIEMEHPKLPESESDPPVQLWTKVGDKDGLNRYCNVGTKMSVLEGDTPKLHRGGILSDDMGLGKTITTLALIRSPVSGEGVIDPPEPEPEDPKRRYSDATLIVCPLSVIANWRDQIRMHVGGFQDCNYHVYHGKDAKNVKNSDLRKCDIVITTYQTLANEYVVDKDGELVRKKSKKPKKDQKLENGTLYKVKWRRVVLDEGHIIRNRKTQAFKAAKALYAERRWILSGTPLINKTDDLGAMLGFTRVCRPLDDAKEWSTYVAQPVKRGREEGSTVLRAVVQSCTLRRTKEMTDSEGKRIVPLPPVSHHVYKVKLDDDIRKLYDTALSAVQERVKGMMARNEHLTQYTNILTYLLRLRQLACAPSLVPEEFLQVARNATTLGDEDAEAEAPMTAEQMIKLRRKLLEMSKEECPICIEPMEEPRILPCTHVMCYGCMEEIVQKDPLCPMCRKPFKLKNAIDLPPNMDETQFGEEMTQRDDCYASKAKELVRLIKITGNQRSLVFSQWTSHLQHLEDTLDDEGITYARYDGSMKMTERDAVIENFKSPSGPQILMLSLACGALGLNLTVAENVFLLDPWWQAAIEQQAIDRVNRIGQEKPVRVFQLIAEDTIEDRVLGIQQRKQKMIEAAFSGTRGAFFERDKTESKFNDIAEALGIAS